MPSATLAETVRLLSFFGGYGAAAVGFGISSTLLVAGTSAGGQSAAGQSAAGPGTAGPAGAALIALAVLIALWAAFLALWSTRCLMAGRVVWPRMVSRLLAVAGAAHLAAVVAGIWLAPAGARSLDVASLCGFALCLLVLGALGWLRIRRQTTRSTTSAPPAGRLLAALFASAVLVAAVTTPGVAAGAAGRSAVPHGSHGSQLNDPALHHGH